MNSNPSLPSKPTSPGTAWKIHAALASLKWIVLGLLGLLLVGGGILALVVCRTPSPPACVTSTGITIAALKEVAKLTVLEVPMTDVVTSEWTGPLHLGCQRCRLNVHGVAEVGSDLKTGRFVDVDQAARRATLVLPTPTALSVRVDHEKSKVYDIDRGFLWKIVPGEIGAERVVNAAYTKAEEMLRTAAGLPEHVEAAKRQAERVIGEACEKLGWTVTVSWK